MTFCYRCGRPLTTDEIGLNRKMIDRSAQRFLCKSCFAAYFGVSEEKVDQKIRQFKAQGCTLFTPD